MAERTIHLKRTGLYASGSNPVNMIQAAFYNEDMTVGDSKDGFMVVCEPLDDSNALLGSASVSVFFEEKLLFEITVRWQEGF